MLMWRMRRREKVGDRKFRLRFLPLEYWLNDCVLVVDFGD